MYYEQDGSRSAHGAWLIYLPVSVKVAMLTYLTESVTRLSRHGPTMAAIEGVEAVRCRERP